MGHVMTQPMLMASTAELGLMTGALVLGLAVPFVAVLVLDAIVGLLRREGPKSLIGAIVMTLVVGGGGYALWLIGLRYTSAAVADSQALIVALLMFTVPIAMVAFVVRTVWSFRRTRQRY